MFGESLPVLAGILLGLLVAQVASQQPQVTVEQGALFGTTETFQEDEFIGVSKNIDVFKGIPFAEPPVGPLRFRAPVGKSSWGSEVYNATYFRDSCIQDPSLNVGSFDFMISEDCLHLNIFAPNQRVPGGVPVMVWIHGGGYTVGVSYLPDYSGLPLVAVGDIVMVSINYRLNVFGFLTTGDEASPGNVGLKDQVMALKWIKKNIAAFGGDSDRITIFGESAGSSSVNLLVLSQQSEGLFSQAIMQSGTSFSPWAFIENKDVPKQQAFQLGEKLGCRATDSAALLTCLRNQDPNTILTASMEIPIYGSPVVDGEFLEDTPTNLYSSGRYNHVKILLGSNADEGTFAIWSDPRFSDAVTSEEPPFVSREMYEMRIAQEFSYYYGETPDHLVNAVNMRYIDWTQADNQTADYFRTTVDAITDFVFMCPSDKAARFHAQWGDDVFLYQMTHDPSVSFFATDDGVGPGWLGATHGEDLIYVFGVAFIPEAAATRSELLDSEKELSVKFMKFWTNFAKTGNPGLETTGSQPASEDDYWPKFTIPELRYKELNVTLTTGRALKSDECHFWNTYFVQLRTMLADMDATEREWKESFYSWKYTDMEDWRDQFNQYKAITGTNV